MAQVKIGNQTLSGSRIRILVDNQVAYATPQNGGVVIHIHGDLASVVSEVDVMVHGSVHGKIVAGGDVHAEEVIQAPAENQHALHQGQHQGQHDFPAQGTALRLSPGGPGHPNSIARVVDQNLNTPNVSGDVKGDRAKFKTIYVENLVATRISCDLIESVEVISDESSTCLSSTGQPMIRENPIENL